jgi:Uma2 family endonuclease
MNILLEDRGIIPGSVKDHASFRRWVRSANFPDSGQFGWLGDKLWMDLSMERNSHNQIKTQVTIVVGGLVSQRNLDTYWSDRMLLTNIAVGLSTEPDGMFATWDAKREGRVRLVGGSRSDGSEVVGSPDMVLEVVSRTSVRKDRKELVELYWSAGISEYWLIDPRGPELRFDILRHTTAGYRTVRGRDGWRRSVVFGATFRLTQTADPIGDPAYALEVR